MKRFKTTIPVYDWACLTVTISDHIIDNDGSLVRGAYSRNDDCCLIELEEHRITPGAIAHEAGHCAWDILHTSGVKISQKNDEALAYLKDWIVRWIEYRIIEAGIHMKLGKPFDGYKKMPRTKRKPRL